MAETRLTNSVIPEVFTGYTAEQSIYKARLFRSGVVEQNGGISNLLAGGGETFNLPFWQDIGGTSGDVPVEGTDQDINNMAAAKQVFRRHSRTKAWGTNDLVKVYAGSNPLESLQNMVIGYWASAFDIMTIASAEGAFAAESGLVNDESTENFSDSLVIDTQALLGENGTVGRGDLNGGDFVAIAVHPSVYAYMRKNDLIDFVPISGQPRPVATYMGMDVIVSGNMPETDGVYDTYIFKQNAFQYGMSTVGYEPTEIDRQPGDGFGIDALYTRRVFGIHPVGFAWQEDNIAGVTPTDAELRTSTEWDLVFNAENARMVALKHTIA